MVGDFVVHITLLASTIALLFWTFQLNKRVTSLEEELEENHGPRKKRD